MKILKSKEDLFEKIASLIKEAKSEVILFSPYITLEALKKLILPIKEELKIFIITSWKSNDIVTGSSDISIYSFCKENNISLLVNNKIHLKVIAVDNMQKAYLGSANITSSGLGIGNQYNIETGVIKKSLHWKDKIYLDNIIQDSSQVDDEYYEKVKDALKNIDKPKIIETFNFNFNHKKNFLLSSLPMSKNVDELFNVYTSKISKGFNEKTIRCAYHDLKLYNIPNGLDKVKFLKTLKNNFSEHPFIVAYTSFIGREKFFGEISSWLHNQVTNIPTPRRYDIKKTQTRLNNFFLELNDDFSTDIPGNRSMRIFKK